MLCPAPLRSAFNKGEFVSEAALEQYAHAMVTGYIGSSSEGHVLSDPNMGVVDALLRSLTPSQ